MVNQLNKDILNKVDEIIDIIDKSEEYQKYLLLKEKMNNNKELKELINEIKVLQKDVTHKLDKKEILKEKMEMLESFPLYREYNNVLSDLNNTYAVIESMINKYFSDKLNQNSFSKNNC